MTGRPARPITTAEAALLLGCSTSHIHNLVNTGVLTNHGKQKPWTLDALEVIAAADHGQVGTPRKAHR